MHCSAQGAGRYIHNSIQADAIFTAASFVMTGFMCNPCWIVYEYLFKPLTMSSYLQLQHIKTSLNGLQLGQTIVACSSTGWYLAISSANKLSIKACASTAIT